MSKCEETAGFLIAAPCKETSSTRCAQCGKKICERHVRESSQGSECIACFRKRGQRYEQEKDDPYLFAGVFYPNYYAAAYGYRAWGDDDRGAFAATESFTDDGDDGWENDFDGS